MDSSTGMWGGDGSWIFAFLIIAIIFGGNGGLFGGANGAAAQYATQADIQRGFDTNTIVNKLDSIGNGICSSSYENARLVGGVNQNMNNGFAGVNASIAGLGYKMDECCCQIKTQLLQDKYDAAQAQLVQAQGIIANTAQTQYILGQLGRYYTYPAVSPYSAYYAGGTVIQ